MFEPLTTQPSFKFIHKIAQKLRDDIASSTPDLTITIHVTFYMWKYQVHVVAPKKSGMTKQEACYIKSQADYTTNVI